MVFLERESAYNRFSQKYKLNSIHTRDIMDFGNFSSIQAIDPDTVKLKFVNSQYC